ncbi:MULTISPECIES: DUF1799 domain-containing protein [unclassified Erwinia]|uniref:DUF1799 domain-containing protein n=1 Tax=unclassified Erwinia TaxID=2622719 RepID=UPI000C18049D|nr:MULTISPECIES: DUF1799 domain-containing protein [unclassified Erwinia]PIJ49199.1 hypothetical protein BV501_13815 [Erwinia sp. OAMSP11]PIJ79894.1 hypothetical protein BLD47_12535 [Erwinia sp. OLCASP19]PIJ81062.1 hypothetical protein BLD46_13345 [Erwinia sp. OLMTSP26]PIJ93118.1 hypothetical protein BL249_05190 [Erwinia sp. OLFS4]
MTPDDIEDVNIEVWPDIWPSFEVFRAMYTQWRTGMNGVTGLDYNVLPWLMKVHGIDDEASALNDIRVMEASALRTIHKNQ